MLGMELDVLNDKTVEGLKRISKAEVEVSIKKRVTDTRVHTDVKEVVTTLRASRVCDDEVSKLQALGDALALWQYKEPSRSLRQQRQHTTELSASKIRKRMTRGGGDWDTWTQLANQRCCTR